MSGISTELPQERLLVERGLVKELVDTTIVSGWDLGNLLYFHSLSLCLPIYFLSVMLRTSSYGA